MSLNSGIAYLVTPNIKQHSIWKFNNTVNNFTYVVTCEEDFPENSFDLSFRTMFTTPSCIKLEGYIVGVKNIYCIVIYVGDKIFYFNRNLPDDYLQTLEKLGEALNKKLTISDFSPLKYITNIGLKGFKNIKGEFDLLT